MKSRWIGAGVMAMGMIMLAGAAGYAGTSRSEPSTDTRQRITLPRAQRDKILAEMRQMLGSIRGVLHGLAANDMPTIERAARVSGMERATDPELKKKVPEGFLKFGIQTHQGFDSLADKAKTGATREDIIKEMAALTNNCVGCHGAYRVVEAR
jgi:cytochrome c556